MTHGAGEAVLEPGKGAMEFEVDGMLNYLALGVLEILDESPSGRCACHIAAHPNINILQGDFFELLSKLMSHQYVTIATPSLPPRKEKEASQNRLEELVRNAAKTGTPDAWRAFFNDISDLDPLPRYYITITPHGRKRLKNDLKQLTSYW